MAIIHLNTDVLDSPGASQVTCYQYHDYGFIGEFGNTWFEHRIVGNNLIKVATYTEKPSFINEDATCYTIQDIRDLPSPYDFMSPIFALSAFALVAFAFFFLYSLIIKPLWSRP